MFSKLVLIAISLNAVFAAPQFVTFKDGNFQVGFGGYHAEAGLGGLLTGNAAHGGLRASAGTPGGQNAAAGLDGLLNGGAGGTAYAGAQANDHVGASAILSGSTVGGAGIAAAESHANGISKTVTKSAAAVPVSVVESETTVQKIHPPKKYAAHSVSVEKTLVLPSPPPPPPVVVPVVTKTVTYDTVPAVPASGVVLVRRKHKHHLHGLHKRLLFQPVQNVVEKRKEVVLQRDFVEIPQHTQTRTVTQVESGSVGGGYSAKKNIAVSPGFVSSWFNIPIGILQSIQQNLQPISGNIEVKKEVSIAKV